MATKEAAETFDELLVRIPGLRRMRTINADLLRTLFERNRGECTWCGGKLSGRRTSWCSDECVSAFKSRCDFAVVRRQVEQRDRGICRFCGCAPELRDRIVKRYAKEVGWPYWQTPPDKYTADMIRLIGWTTKNHTWEAHHVSAVAEGGGLCTADEVVTACLPCHKAETKQLAGRLAAQGK